MKRLLFLTAMLMTMGCVVASEISVANVAVPKGGKADAIIMYQFDAANVFSGYNFSLVLPDGFTAAKKTSQEMLGSGDCYTSTHTISTNYVETTKENIYACFSTESECLTGTNGVLLRIEIVADESLEIGESFTATMKDISIGKADGTSEKQGDFTFTVTIGEPADTRTVLEETSSTVPSAATGVDVRVKRSISANTWSTLVLPFDMTETQVKEALGDDVQLADFTSWSSEEDDEGDITAITLGFTDVTTIEANHPYIIKVSADVTEFTVDGVDITPEEEPTVQVGKKKAERGYFTGTYVSNTTVPENNLFLDANKFWYSTGQTKMKAFRAYFELADVLTCVEMGAAPRINMVFDDNMTTGINDASQLMNITNNVYDLQGRKVENPRKGLYIKGNKKVVIK